MYASSKQFVKNEDFTNMYLSMHTLFIRKIRLCFSHKHFLFVCSNVGSCPFPRGNNYDLAKYLDNI